MFLLAANTDTGMRSHSPHTLHGRCGGFCESPGSAGVKPTTSQNAMQPCFRQSGLNLLHQRRPGRVSALNIKKGSKGLPKVAASVAMSETNPKAGQDAASFTTPSPVMTIDESEYTPQLERKLQRLRELFSTLPLPAGESLPAPEVFTSAPSHYRMRAEFTVWGTSSKALQSGPPDVHFIMYDTSSGVKPPPRIRINTWPVGSQLMNEQMQVVINAANQVPVLRERLFQVNFHTALSGESMVTLLYHKKLDDLWQEAAKKLRDQLAQCPSCQGHMPHVIGRSHKQKVELDASHVTERLTVNGQQYTYRQVEGSFSQPNAGVCQHMLSWAQRVTRPSQSAASDSTHLAISDMQQQAQQGDAVQQPPRQAEGSQHDHELLELYCGNGNFTIPLAGNFRRVVATEVSKSSVEAARHNITVNGVTNIFVARMSSEEFSEAWRTKASKKRLEGLGSWDDLQMRTVLVDPPRAGLDAQTLKLVAEFDQVVYISCNPETLYDNLTQLVTTHQVTNFAAFDQFPYTHHLETGVFLTKRK